MAARKKRAVNNYKSPLEQEQDATQKDENTPSDDDMPIAASDLAQEEPQQAIKCQGIRRREAHNLLEKNPGLIEALQTLQNPRPGQNGLGIARGQLEGIF